MSEESAVVADEVSGLSSSAELSALSIQGEQHQGSGWIRASDDDVDLYVDRVSDEVLACRERGPTSVPDDSSGRYPLH